MVQALVDAGGVPEHVDIYAIATAIDSGRANYPPEAWLEREGWSSPVVVDTKDAIANAYGLGGFPFWVFVNSDGTTALRVGGRISADELTLILQHLQ